MFVQMFAQKFRFLKPHNASLRNFHVPTVENAFRSTQQIITDLSKNKDFAEAIHNKLINLEGLSKLPAEKVQEIHTLCSPQKYYRNALGFMNFPHKLYTMEALMACDLREIQAYKTYLHALSYRDIAAGAFTLEKFVQLDKTEQEIMIKQSTPLSSHYFASCE